MISASEVSTAFPEIAHGIIPLGGRVLVQLRTVRAKTTSGILLVEDTKDFNKTATQLGKVISFGPLAYRSRNTGELWPEGSWVDAGDLVRVPKYGGDRFEIPIEGTDDTAIFVLLSDHEISAKVNKEAFESIDKIL